jgi:hypothetical protein
MTEAITVVKVNLTGLTKSSKVLHVPRITLRMLSVTTNLFPSEGVKIPVDKNKCFKYVKDLVLRLLLIEKKILWDCKDRLMSLGIPANRKNLEPIFSNESKFS